MAYHRFLIPALHALVAASFSRRWWRVARVWAQLALIACALLAGTGRSAPPAFAQEQVRHTDTTAPAPTTSTPSGTSSEPVDHSDSHDSGWFPDWLSDPGRWASDVFTRSVAALLESIAGFLRTAVQAVLNSSANFITRTPPEVSYASPTVRSLWEVTRAIANGALVLVALWGGSRS